MGTLTKRNSCYYSSSERITDEADELAIYTLYTCTRVEVNIVKAYIYSLKKVDYIRGPENDKIVNISKWDEVSRSR